MRYNVVIFRESGETEVFAADVDGDTADAMLRHPSLSGLTVAILANWQVNDLPASMIAVTVR